MAILSTEPDQAHPVPVDVWTRRIKGSSAVTRNRQRVALCIARHGSIPNREIARRLHLSERTVTRCTNSLLAWGWLTLHSEGRRGTTYAENLNRVYHLGLPEIDASCTSCEHVDRVTKSPRIEPTLSPLTRGIAASPTVTGVTEEASTQRTRLTLVRSSPAPLPESQEPHPDSAPEVPLPPQVETPPSLGDPYADDMPIVAYALDRMERMSEPCPLPPTQPVTQQEEVS